MRLLVLTLHSSLDEAFTRFVSEYRIGDDYPYQQQLNEIGYRGLKPLVVNFSDLYNYDPDLGMQLIQHPKDSLKEFEATVKNRVQIRGLPEATPIRQINSAQIGTFIMVNGIIVKAYQDTSKISLAAYTCMTPQCEYVAYVNQPNQFLRKPEEKCPECKANKWELDFDKTTYKDSQLISIQESTDQLPPGEIPRRLEIILNEELVKVANPGERVSVTGWITVKLSNPISLKLELERFLVANHVEVLNREDDSMNLSDKERLELEELSKEPNIARRIVKSMAPSIYGYEDIKKAIALQLFGAPPIQKPDVKIRGDVNILLIGDPGTAKSQMLKFATSASSRGIYTTGGGASRAGLTAAVLKEKDGGFYLEAGALVLADTGLCAIDEGEKMKDEDRDAIHPAMEQQCYDKETQVLTDNGWKFFKDVTKDDLIASLNNGQLVYEKSISFTKYNYTGDMYTTIDSNKIDFMVTPNHKMFVEIYERGSEWGEPQLIEVSEISDRRLRFKRDVVWEGKDQEYYFISSTYKKTNASTGYWTEPIKISINDWLEFMGYFLSEGYVNSYRVNITQVKEKQSQKIKDCLDRLPFKFHQYGIHYNCSDLRLSRHILSQGKQFTRFIPRDLLSLPPSRLRILYDAMMLGDGSKSATMESYTTISPRLADDFQELCFKMGYTGVIKTRDTRGNKVLNGIAKYISYIINVQKKNEPQINYHPSRDGKAGKIVTKPYNGVVYCLEVPSHIIYVRRNGKPIWCGNCVTIAKAGIVATLNARCSILMAANPTLGRYNAYQTVAENINKLPVTLLSRFDLIFIMIDQPEENKDQLTGEKILELSEEGMIKPLNFKQLKRYIGYSKTVNPLMSEAIRRRLVDYYVSLRKSSQDNQAIMITPRQLESLIRLTKAHARMHLRGKVNDEDVHEAVALFEASMKQVGVDPETGKMDIDLIETGRSKNMQQRLSIVLEAVAHISMSSVDGVVHRDELLEAVTSKGITEFDYEKLIGVLLREGIVFSPRPNLYKRAG